MYSQISEMKMLFTSHENEEGVGGWGRITVLVWKMHLSLTQKSDFLFVGKRSAERFETSKSINKCNQKYPNN